jgi:serine/threonine-protein kinase HipA
VSTATVKLWGTAIGYVSMDRGEDFARFEYEPDFAAAGIELAPLSMPVAPGRIYRFPELHPRSFHGLPGLLADSLPDRYGNRLIDVWLAATGRERSEFNAVDRLCYTGQRGMGALEFEPAQGPRELADRPLEVAQLVELAALAFAAQGELAADFSGADGDRALLDILSVGTSAGGARAKAVIAFDPRTREVRSGQTRLPAGFEHWLIKFDGVRFSGDWGVADPSGYGLLEYSYAQVARACGIEQSECRLLEENGRSHFMTRRFDRGADGQKHFVQTFAALAHFDYYDSGVHSYEQLFATMQRLGLPHTAVEEQFRRVLFNLVGCNQDDHVKNHAFLMDRRGRWSLSPAYDLCHAEGSRFTGRHQLSLGGKTGDFTKGDLKALAAQVGLTRGRELRLLDRTLEAFAQWPTLARDLAIPRPLVEHVTRTQRLSW